MATPKVTINVLNPQVSEEEKDAMIAGLHMLYVQAQKGDERFQWVVFPPANPVLDVKVKAADQGQCLMLERFQEFKGNRSKWFHKKLPVGQSEALLAVLREKATEGFTVGMVVAVPLIHEEYVKVWNGETPHKALRHVDYALRPYKITLK